MGRGRAMALMVVATLALGSPAAAEPVMVVDQACFSQQLLSHVGRYCGQSHRDSGQCYESLGKQARAWQFGERHHTEANKVDLRGIYPLADSAAVALVVCLKTVEMISKAEYEVERAAERARWEQSLTAAVKKLEEIGPVAVEAPTTAGRRP